MRREMLSAACCFVVLIVCGCSHQLEVVNMASYRNVSLVRPKEQMKVGLNPATNKVASQKIVKGVRNALSEQGALTICPYNKHGQSEVDYRAKISVASEYSGSGWNFLINWPGFLIFTPAWHGYIYYADYDVQVVLIDAHKDKTIDSFSVPAKFDIRQAEIDRTWTEVGWLEWGVIPLVGGVVFTSYDADITPELLRTIKQPLGDYIAHKIIVRLNNYYIVNSTRDSGATRRE